MAETPGHIYVGYVVSAASDVKLSVRMVGKHILQVLSWDFHTDSWLIYMQIIYDTETISNQN